MLLDLLTNLIVLTLTRVPVCALYEMWVCFMRVYVFTLAISCMCICGSVRETAM